MGQQETEKLNELMHGAALTRAICTVAELGLPIKLKRASHGRLESWLRPTGVMSNLFTA